MGGGEDAAWIGSAGGQGCAGGGLGMGGGGDAVWNSAVGGQGCGGGDAGCGGGTGMGKGQEFGFSPY